jgi:hypothetical protein
MVRYYGNEDKELDQIETGTLYELKVGTAGNFVDWAYGASKNPSILANKCND